jgi:hypothetical protein
MTKPVAVLKRLEDSPPGVDQELILAYLSTSYRVPELGLDYRIGRLEDADRERLERDGTRSFAFVTAWNPCSEKRSAGENRRHNRRLAEALDRLGRRYHPGLHVAAAGDWPDEESFYIVNISSHEVIALARQFDQNAVVFWERGGVPEIWLVHPPEE